MELCDSKGYKRRIPITDIDDIEPVQGRVFNLNVYNYSLAQGLLSQFTKKSDGGNIKTEQYQSKHIAEILDTYQSLLKQLVDEEEQEEKEQEEFEKMHADELDDSDGNSEKTPETVKVQPMSKKVKNRS